MLNQCFISIYDEFLEHFQLFRQIKMGMKISCFKLKLQLQFVTCFVLYAMYAKFYQRIVFTMHIFFKVSLHLPTSRNLYYILIRRRCIKLLIINYFKTFLSSHVYNGIYSAVSGTAKTLLSTFQTLAAWMGISICVYIHYQTRRRSHPDKLQDKFRVL